MVREEASAYIAALARPGSLPGKDSLYSVQESRKRVVAKILDLQTTYRAIVDAASKGRYITYGELAEANGVEWSKARFPLNDQLGELMRIAAERGWPLPSSIVVSRENVETGKLAGSSRSGFHRGGTGTRIERRGPGDLCEGAARKDV